MCLLVHVTTIVAEVVDKFNLSQLAALLLRYLLHPILRQCHRFLFRRRCCSFCPSHFRGMIGNLALSLAPWLHSFCHSACLFCLPVTSLGQMQLQYKPRTAEYHIYAAAILQKFGVNVYQDPVLAVKPAPPPFRRQARVTLSFHLALQALDASLRKLSSADRVTDATVVLAAQRHLLRLRRCAAIMRLHRRRSRNVAKTSLTNLRPRSRVAKGSLTHANGNTR